MTPEPTIKAISLGEDALLALHAALPERYPALFQSAAAAEPLGRFDILFACPGPRLILHHDGVLGGDAPVPRDVDFLRALDEWWTKERAPIGEGRLPFLGGWLLFLGYELAGVVEPSLRLPPSPHAPIAEAVRIPAAILYEHASRRAWMISEAPEIHFPLMQRDLSVHGCATPAQLDEAITSRSIVEDAPEKFLGAVERALEHIRRGDIYQANLSRAWRAPLTAEATPAALYRRLRRANPGPFAGLAILTARAIVTSSPERLVQVRDGWVSTRPIAGTRPRSSDRSEDASLAAELHAHPKERAEHIMLIDLERNDLGRICEPGSVHVDEYMTIESYSHVHHIVSNVKGQLRAQVTPGEVLRAVFPGGTITGCPKVRCMQIIGELEGEGRGAYTGSLGYLNRDGTMDLNILIRTIELLEGCAIVRAGAGIVADSVPERELEETRAKARGVLRALASGDARP